MAERREPELSIVNVRTVDAPCAIVAGKAAAVYVGTGAAVTARDALAAGLLPTSEDKPLVAMLALGTATSDVTGTVIRQVEFAATVPPVREILPVPATALMAPQVLVTAGVAATTTFIGRISVKFRPVTVLLLPL